MSSPAENCGIVSAFTESQASRLTGVSVRQLQYWDRTGLFSPQFADENRRSAFSRIYSFVDVKALRVLNALRRKHGVSLQHLREVGRKLAALDNGAWSRVTLYVLKRRVAFHDPQDGKQREVVSGQYCIDLPLAKVDADLRRDVAALSVRDNEQIGKIRRDRHVSHNSPVIAGTRIPVRAIKTFHEDGYTTDQILAEYPSLTAADVKAAIDFDPNAKAA